MPGLNGVREHLCHLQQAHCCIPPRTAQETQATGQPRDTESDTGHSSEYKREDEVQLEGKATARVEWQESGLKGEEDVVRVQGLVGGWGRIHPPTYFPPWMKTSP